MATKRSAAALAVVAIIAPTIGAPDAPSQWQYFCFESASQFAQVATKTIFSVLPDPEGGVAERRRAEAAAVSSSSSAGDASGVATTVEQAAAKLSALRGTCYFMRIGYWTYEVCPWVSVRQYHSENSANGGTPSEHSEHVLGKYAQGIDEFNAERTIYSQHFTSGAEGRSCVVRYLCPDSWRDEDGIVVVHEPKPKQYVITLRVQALCDGAAGGGGAARAAEGGAADASAGTGAASRGRATASQTPPADAAKASAEGAAEVGRGMQIAEMVLPNTRMLSALRGRCVTPSAGTPTHLHCTRGLATTILLRASLCRRSLHAEWRAGCIWRHHVAGASR